MTNAKGIMEKQRTNKRYYCKIKDIIDTIKTNNPYPVDIFAEPTREEYIKVQKLFKDAGLVQDKFFGAYGRKVWNNCIANIEKELEVEDING